MKVEIISVGTELLLGDILNSNAQYLSKELAYLGINVYRQTTVGDNIERLVKCFKRAFDDGADVVITTGGLGPTGDDITKEAASSFFGQEMFLDEVVWQEVMKKCAKFSGNIENVPKNNTRQAMFPKEAKIIPNPYGTAPGAIFQKDNRKIVVMPGPPREMKHMFKDSVIPELFSGSKTRFKSKYIRFYGIGESSLEIKLLDILNSQTNPTVALYAKEGEVLIRVTARCEDDWKCDIMLSEKINEIKSICGEYIYLIGDDSISESQSEMDKVVAKMLVDRKKTIAVAESCTGGMVAASLVNYPGISESLLEGCVTYSNAAKMSRLGVKKDTLDRFGAVSKQTAMEMARGVAENLGADIGISTTGIAGPDGGSEEKPVGLVYIGLYCDGETTYTKKVFSGNREMVRKRATKEALNIIRLKLIDNKNS